jgi:hypothetical protein
MLHGFSNVLTCILQGETEEQPEAREHVMAGERTPVFGFIGGDGVNF